jgi:hypothetical protein
MLRSRVRSSLLAGGAVFCGEAAAPDEVSRDQSLRRRVPGTGAPGPLADRVLNS